MHFADHDILTAGDAPDVLVAMNPAALKANLSDLASAATSRDNLGLGSAAVAAAGDFQPVDSDLTAIAALATAAFGRSVLTQADAAALRTLAVAVQGAVKLTVADTAPVAPATFDVWIDTT